MAPVEVLHIREVAVLLLEKASEQEIIHPECELTSPFQPSALAASPTTSTPTYWNLELGQRMAFR